MQANELPRSKLRGITGRYRSIRRKQRGIRPGEIKEQILNQRRMMMNESEEKEMPEWDCCSFPCGDSCCQHGVDVFTHERDLLISSGKATADDFLRPKTDKTGTTMYRTKIGPRGCIFLLNERGCSLHISGHKPSVCREWPRTLQEAKRAANEDYLPCFPHRYSQGINE